MGGGLGGVGRAEQPLALAAGQDEVARTQTEHAPLIRSFSVQRCGMPPVKTLAVSSASGSTGKSSLAGRVAGGEVGGGEGTVFAGASAFVVTT